MTSSKQWRHQLFLYISGEPMQCRISMMEKQATLFFVLFCLLTSQWRHSWITLFIYFFRTIFVLFYSDEYVFLRLSWRMVRELPCNQGQEFWNILYNDNNIIIIGFQASLNRSCVFVRSRLFSFVLVCSFKRRSL